MSNTTWSNPTRDFLPTILIRGFGGLDIAEEKKSTYYGFNDGTVYPQKQGENYIYEGLILRFMKSDWGYQDATNIVNYYSQEMKRKRENLPDERLVPFDEMGFFDGHKLVIDPAMALKLIRSEEDPRKTLWVFRYYDFDDRDFETYSDALVRLIDFIRALVEKKSNTPIKESDIQKSGANKVNIIAHSMGGLIVRHAIQSDKYGFRKPDRSGATADESINKIVTLGTPHKGITFQILQNLRWLPFLAAGKEIEQFNPARQEKEENPVGFKNFHQNFPLDRFLTIVGTNYRTYNIPVSTAMNRLFPVSGEYGATYNRSDGLVKQSFAQIPGSPRTFVHKCHGEPDSIITARETYEIATRFFFGDVRARIYLKSAEIKSGKDIFGKSEFFFGMSIRPRSVDFDLFHQSKEAENCYGPFYSEKLDDDPKTVSFSWAGENRLIWEGNFIKNPDKTDLAIRLRIYVGERDVFGIGFSDKQIFHADYFIRAVLSSQISQELQLYLYDDERFDSKSVDDIVEKPPMSKVTTNGWEFSIKGRNFDGTFIIELEDLSK